MSQLLKTEIIKEAIGVRVDLPHDLIGDPAVSRELRDLLDRHTVIVFPQANFTDAEQLALTDALGGQINIKAQIAGHEEAEPVYQVTLNEGAAIEKEYVLGTFFWHMDGLTVNSAPPKATVLSARRLSDKGGQTEFASTRAAWAALPEEEKAEIADLRVIHTVTASLREVCPPEDVDDVRRAMSHEHPLVRTHADGSRSLVIGSTGDVVIGKTRAEGRSLLLRLQDWAAQPAFSYRHHWQPGDCVIWDNMSALHRVVPYAQNSGRVMHRTAIASTAAAA